MQPAKPSQHTTNVTPDACTPQLNPTRTSQQKIVDHTKTTMTTQPVRTASREDEPRDRESSTKPLEHLTKQEWILADIVYINGVNPLRLRFRSTSGTKHLSVKKGFI